MEVLDCIKTRRSVRKFSSKEVDMALLGKILDAGLEAPSAGNLQNWKLILIKGHEKRQAIAEAAVQQYWIAQAPAIIVVCSMQEKVKSFYGMRGDRLYSIQSCAAATQNILLAAHSLSLASCWVSAFDEDMLKRALNIPEKVRPQAIIPIGYAAEHPKLPILHHIESMVDIENWGSRFTDAPVEIMEDYHILVSRGITKTKEILNAIFRSLKGKK